MRSPLALDLYTDVGAHILEELDLYLDHACLLDRLVEHDLPLVDILACLLLDGIGDVHRSDRAKEFAVVSDLGPEYDFLALELLCELLSLGSVGSVLLGSLGLLSLDGLYVGSRSLNSEPLRDQFVPCEAVANLDSISCLACTFYVLFENYFHIYISYVSMRSFAALRMTVLLREILNAFFVHNGVAVMMKALIFGG
jgi:hypothetical protein